MNQKQSSPTPPHPRRFVVLFHQCREGDHFDLMIENGEKLAAWKFQQPPERAQYAPLPGQRIGEHRRLYLDYEGDISGDRGHVRRYDAGMCGVISGETEWQVTFEGALLRGAFQLIQNDPPAQGWDLRCSRV